jgi:hypothetical protein
MPSVRLVSLLGGTLLALVGLAPGAVAAEPTYPLHLVKDCSTFLGTTPSFCLVATTEFPGIPVGTKVLYEGPVLTDTLFLSSNVLLDTGRGSTATGYCINVARPPGDPRTSTGLCSFWEGTGALSGFHAVVDVSIDAAQEFHWDGVYYFSAPAAALAHAYPMRPRDS